jgi:hypothetical protein
VSALNGQMPHTHETAPGDGWTYSVLISELPHDGYMGGGSTNDFVVVTLWRPHDQGVGRTYVMSKHGPLTDRYIKEKFCDDLDSPEMIRHIADCIRESLGRPNLSDEHWQGEGGHWQ